MNKTHYRIRDIGTSFGDAPFGTSLKSKDYTIGGIPVIQGGNIVDQVFEWNRKLYTSEEKFNSLKRSHCNAGDLAFPKIGNRTVGSCAIIPAVEGHTTFLLSTNMMKMSVNSEIADIKYVYYYFCQSSIRQKIISEAGGGAQPIFNFTSLKNFEIDLPSLPIQRKIADVLSAYDDLIEVNARRIRALEAMAQSVYREWFGSVDARSLPRGWEMKKLGEAIELAYGKPLKSDQRISGQYPVYGSAGIVGSHNEFIVEAPGIVVGRKGNVGSIFWANENFYPIDTTYFVKAPISLYYVFFNLQTQHFINNDAAVPGLSRNQAYSLPFVVPSKDVLDKFDEFIIPIFQQLNNLTKRNANLRRTRDLLLPRLVSGEVGVDEVQS